MEHVVYILGAGFSAPLGLPVMSNFLVKSKDLYFQNPEKFRHFDNIFQEVQKMSFIKNFYDADLFNIEEILSILEMNNMVSNSSDPSGFIKYLTDVIASYTPTLAPYPGSMPGNWGDFIFGDSGVHANHANFVSELIGVEYSSNKFLEHITKKQIPYRSFKYSVITLNYDLVIENVVHFLNARYPGNNISIMNGIAEKEDLNEDTFYLAKLHGCISNGCIVPPTWKKASNPDIEHAWILARKLLEDANQIRFMGYSLPSTDSYLKYLFKASVMNAPNLKKIDVINLDNTNRSRERYDDFIKFNYFRYKNGDITKYTEEIAKKFKTAYNVSNSYGNGYDFTIPFIEMVHDNFMNS